MNKQTMLRAMSLVMAAGIMSAAVSCSGKGGKDSVTPTDTVSVEEVSNAKNARVYPDEEEFNNVSQHDLEFYLEDVKASVENYYRAAVSDKQDFPELVIPLTEDCEAYMRQRFAYDTRDNLGEAASTYLNGKYELADYSVVNNRLICNVHVEVHFRYKDADFDSGMGEMLQIVVENPSAPVIADWYNGSPESFDSIVRGYGLDLKLQSNLLEKHDIKKLLKKGQKTLDDVAK